MAEPDGKPPDVLLHVPDLHVGKIELEVEDLQAHVRLDAKVLDLVSLQVGADVSLGRVGLTIEDVGLQAILKVRLDAVERIVIRLLETLDNNPEIIRDLTRGVGQAVEHVGEGAGEGVKEIGKGTGKGVEQIGGGVGSGVEEVGRGAGKGVEKVGEGAGEGVKEVGKGTGKGVEGVGKGAGEGVKKTGEGVGKAGEGAGKSIEKSATTQRKSKDKQTQEETQ